MGFRGHAAFALTLLVAAPAAASPVAKKIAKAERLITKDLRYEPATQILERALQDTRITNREKVEGYRLLGIAYVARGKTEAGRAAFSALLDLDPSYTLDPRTSPKIIQVFERAREAIGPKILDVQAFIEGRRVVVSGRVDDPRAALTAIDLYTRAGSEAFERQTMTRTDGRVAGVVDVPELSRLRVDYYVVGRRNGEDLVAVGDAEAPLSVVVERAAPPPPPPPIVVRTLPTDEPAPWYGTWWFWTLTGVVVVGTAVGLAVALPTDPDPPPGTLDPIRLP